MPNNPSHSDSDFGQRSFSTPLSGRDRQNPARMRETKTSNKNLSQPKDRIASRIFAELIRVRPTDLMHPFADPRATKAFNTQPQFAPTGYRVSQDNKTIRSVWENGKDQRTNNVEQPGERHHQSTPNQSGSLADDIPEKKSAPTSATSRSQSPSRAFSTAITAEAFFGGLAPLVVGDAGAEVDPVIVGSKYGTGRQVPDTVIDGWRSENFVLRSVSLRGRMHRYNGAPRQDSVLARLSDDGRTLFIAVADGVSSAPQSHRGSEIAARYAVGWMLKKYSAELSAMEWQSLAKGASFSIQQLAEESGADPMDFASTLVCAAVTRQDEGLCGHVLSIGDSGSWIVGNNGLTLIEGGKDESNVLISSSAVQPLPIVPADLDAKYFESDADETILFGTDGVGDPLGGGGGPLSDLFVQRLYKRVPSITEFCHLVDFSKAGFDDDRTLISIWPSQLGIPKQ